MSNYQNKCCLFMFFIFFASTTADIISNFLSWDWVALLSYARFPSLILLVFFHGIFSFGGKKAIIFFSTSFSLSLTSELLGSCCGLIFGKYTYANQPFMVLGLVPILTPFFWLAIVYIAFSMTNLFANSVDRYDHKSPFLLVLLSALDGLVVMNIDMISEPISVLQGRWVWEKNGPYFGIPIENFFGWWLVTFLITLFFRFYNRKKENKKITNPLLFISVSVYFLIFIRQFFMALEVGHPEYALVGVASILPTVFIFLLVIYATNGK